jgi:hypothetical protein
MLALSAMNFITGQTTLRLSCHPRSTCHEVTAIAASVSVTEESGLRAGFVLEGVLAALRIPEARPARRVDGLWRHTCFEIFVMADSDPAYREFNVSPSGEWAAYGFRGYREGGTPIAEAAPVIQVRKDGDRLSVGIELGGNCLPRGRDLRLGLSAVVETGDRALSYWALRHPAQQPDFHHADAFALKLAVPPVPEADIHAAEAVP